MQDIMQNEFVIKNRLFFLFTTISYLGYFHVNSLLLGVEEGGIVKLLIKLHIYLFNNIWNEKKKQFYLSTYYVSRTVQSSGIAEMSKRGIFP